MVFEINTSIYEKLPRSFYERADVVEIAKDLLGKLLVTETEGVLTIGKIVETEAYCGRGDKACHANEKRTPRTEVMYGPAGCAYVYLCYGIHHLFNVVTNVEGQADAVLIRALEPVYGTEAMRERRNHTKAKLASGPGTLSQAMGIKTNLTGVSLTGESIWITKDSNENAFEILADTRIGVEYAEEDALKPWRFVIAGNTFVSKPVKNKSPANHTGLS
ncbi:DNA-3-methyladenine glycosylase [Ekhidna lutea]|uniref:Putative 3-methyladenine DNA glycosylase n=1 Tax=Ekhidna lutea TaxID=447679 RepID=A0A239K3V3_EKHLU|nr:DNA-3-methyladenine glycosylase [Ekhidna lutea]SNT13076.1 DNA-3-methyladenine glycosylase [Ekhidna lutea]